MKIKINDDLTLTTYSENIPAQYSSNIPFELELPEKYQNSLIVPGYIFYDRNKKIESAIDNYNDGRFTLPSNTFLKDGMIGIAFSIKSGDLIETTEIAQFKVRKSVNTSFSLPDQVTWQSMLQNFMDQYMDKVYSAEIRGLIDKAKELQASDEILQELINTAIKSCGQYKFENGQLFFKQADGTWGEGINLNVSVEEFENIVRRVTSLETNGVAVGDTLPIGSIVYIEGDEKDIPTGYQKLDIVPQPPKQLLINNDFQVNQRSQTAYSGEMKKCYDGWLLIRGFVTNIAYATYPKPKDGILMVYNTNYENNQLWQFLDEELDYEKYYTLSYAADGVHYSFTFKPTPTGYQENIHDRFRVYTALESSRQKRAICVELFQGKAINLEYIDLFEGKIAYQHKKEDYAITLLKCHQWIKRIYQNCPIMYEYGSATFSYNFVCAVHDMEYLPNANFTFEAESWMYYDSAGNAISGANNLTVVGIANNQIILTTPSGSRKSSNCYGVLLSGIISREPV